MQPWTRFSNPAVVEPPGFREALATWLADAQTGLDQRYASFRGTAIESMMPRVEVEQGPKYVRVIQNDGTSRSVMHFIDRGTGDVLKPAGWKGPAKGVRGNIFRMSGASAVQPHALYARGR